MTGCLKGFVFIAQKQNSNIIHTHCFIHREALVAKTFGTALNSVLDMVSGESKPEQSGTPFQ